MRFNENGEYDIRIHYGDAFIAWVIHRLRLDKFVDNRRKYHFAYGFFYTKYLGN